MYWQKSKNELIFYEKLYGLYKISLFTNIRNQLKIFMSMKIKDKNK